MLNQSIAYVFLTQWKIMRDSDWRSFWFPEENNAWFRRSQLEMEAWWLRPSMACCFSSFISSIVTPDSSYCQFWFKLLSIIWSAFHFLSNIAVLLCWLWSLVTFFYPLIVLAVIISYIHRRLWSNQNKSIVLQAVERVPK